tara:strand:+ start:673 stop:999 length:327 start_codon:yes stop_codon:yes gene_type:complete
MRKPTYFDAVDSLVGAPMGGPDEGPISEITFDDNEIPGVKDGVTLPTEKEIQAEIARLQAEYDAQEYARKREAEYPTIAELTVALYDTDDKSAVEAKRAAVKLKYPKP